MNTQFSRLLAAFLMITPLIFIQCNSDNDAAGIGQLSVEITDSPIDDPNVKGVFVTVADVRIDGESWEGFSGKATFDLLALQNGKVRPMGSGEIESGVYSNIELVLDVETDVEGNAPAAYVITLDDTRHPIHFSGGAEQVIQISDSAFDIEEDMMSSVVIDFDLRKSVVSTGNGDNKVYAFVTSSAMQDAVRVVNKEQSGHISGNVNMDTSAQQVIVYAYHKGGFSESEMEPDAATGVRFAHAVTSAAVDQKGDYMLAFLTEGEYEVVFAGYNENADGELDIVGLLALDALLGGQAEDVTVDANTTTTLNVEIIGILP